ncbi:hypothetical protein VNO80_11505 [Phaseolus coccineus]|uniref:Uncharacterized protein n=1 Tax=Phaseolus coccineus TaxID=3886 RepID=A0AAN9NAP8_PHACN
MVKWGFVLVWFASLIPPSLSLHQHLCVKYAATYWIKRIDYRLFAGVACWGSFDTSRDTFVRGFVGAAHDHDDNDDDDMNLTEFIRNLKLDKSVYGVDV